MPDFHFVYSADEELKLVGELLKEGYDLFQQSGSKSRLPPCVKGVRHYRNLRKNIIQWLLAHCAYTSKPFDTEYVENPWLPGYSVTPRWGGPLILLSVGWEQFAEPDSKELGGAMLHHYPYYWNCRNGKPIDTFDAPEELKRRYKGIVKRIKEGSKCYKLVGRRTWIGPEAEAMLRLGWKIGNPDADRDFRRQESRCA